MENFKVITITHHNLNVDELGYFVVKHSDNADLKAKLDILIDKMKLNELIYLSTCNRVSFIFTGNHELSTQFLQDFFKVVNPSLSQEHLEKINKFTSTYEGIDAINHIFRVAASMDSLVVGEREIFRQLREAYNRSLGFGHVGDNLRLLDRYTVTAAKEVYEKTKIGERPLSIVSLSIQELYANNLNEDSRILMVGAGETNTLVAKFLQKKSFKNVAVFNRNIDNAAHISELLSAQAYHLSDLASYDKGFDVLIICTGSTEPIVTPTIYRKLLQRSTDEKIIVDLSVPANVAPEVVTSFDNTYIDIEKLRARADENLAFRKQELIAAKALLKEKLIEFKKAHHQRQLELMLKEVPKAIKEVKHHAVSNVYAKKLNLLDQDSKALVLEMMDYMEKKCISVPMRAVKALS